MSYLAFLSEHGPTMLLGTVTTVKVLICATILYVIISIIFGLMRISKNPIIQGVATVYIEFFRGTSLLVQLFWFYYVLPFFGISLEAFTAGVVAIGMNFGAYGAEIVRGGILAVPKGQWEAAFALNFTPTKRMKNIIIPQIFPIILPPAANLTVELLKATALVALVTVVDLTFEAKQINAITWLSAQCFGTALLIYYIISRFFLVPFLRWLEVVAARKVGKEIK
ncbi:ectoine/hydroxyectoine ABC transporter permease subunit EhuC [Candidatus Pelagibacter bacterium nBUS_49]|uniref:ectoine/hydroxyectoine ABC transporter permease subunit EhuC n=1 Tax=Candidatus Pelagibacter bacterium nBUS_49 TaxID=3374196 RepID=UPI003EBE39EB